MSSSPSKPPSPKRPRSTSPSHPIILILVGLPGSGKSNFASALVTRSPHRWARINQDTINKGKRGTKELCLAAAQSALSRGCNVVIDRTNLSQAQRKDFLDLASKADPAPAALHCVFFNLPTKECGARAAQREDHEGGVQGPNAYRAVGMMQRELTNGGAPTLQEGFLSMIECLDDQDIDAALELWVPYSARDAVGGLTLAEEWEKVRPKKRTGSGNGGLQRLDKFFGQKKEKLGAAGEEGVEKVLEGKEVSQMGKKKEDSGRSALGTNEAAGGKSNRVTAPAAQPAAAPAREGISQAQPSNTNINTINTNAPSTSNAFSFMMAAAKQQAHQPGGGGSPSPSKSQLKHQSSRHTFLSHGAISALNRYLKDPERLLHSGDALFCDSQCVAVDDKFPKARFHILVIARDLRLQGPMDLTGSDVGLVRHMKVRQLRYCINLYSCFPFFLSRSFETILNF